MSYIKYTKASTFLFPLLGLPKDLFRCEIRNDFSKLIMTTRFINCYFLESDFWLNIDPYPKLNIVVKGYRDINFQSFIDTLTSFSNYIDDYDESEFLVIIFKIPDIFLPDYYLLLEGKYSEISKEAKKIIISNNYYSGKSPSTIPLILSKSTALKNSWEKRLSNKNSEVDLGDQEVWSIIDQKEETLTLEKLKSLGKKSKINK